MGHSIIINLSFVSLCLVWSAAPTWAVSWLCLLVQAIRAGLSRRTPLLFAGTRILLTGTVRHAGRGEMAACPTPVAFTLSTGAAKVGLAKKPRTMECTPWLKRCWPWSRQYTEKSSHTFECPMQKVIIFLNVHRLSAVTNAMLTLNSWNSEYLSILPKVYMQFYLPK